MGTGEPNNAETSAKALFGMRPSFEDQFAQRRRRRPNPRRVFADAIDRPASVTAMARRHVLGSRRVLVIAAGAPVRGDPLALEKHLDGAHRHTRFDIGADEAKGDAVIMVIDLDVIVDADAAFFPFRELVRLRWQGLQRRTIDLLSQRQTNILGLICNDVNIAESEYNYGYYYRQTMASYSKEIRAPA